MMKFGHLHFILLSLLCIALLAANAYVRFSNDQAGPVLEIPDKKLVYVEGESYDELLLNMKAVDVLDGDVSDTIRIRSILPSGNGETALVHYICKDRSNNLP